MVSVGEFVGLTLLGMILLGIGWYASPIGFGFQVLVGVVGAIFLIVGILGIIDKLTSSNN
jgi:hypothetical protein